MSPPAPPARSGRRAGRVCHIIDEAIQIHGATGLSQRTALAALYTTQWTIRLTDGPDEVQWHVVGRAELSRQRMNTLPPTSSDGIRLGNLVSTRLRSSYVLLDEVRRLEVTAVVSLHIADVGAGAGLRLLRQGFRPGGVGGLRHANMGAAATLSGSLLPRPMISRIGLICFWDNERALDKFDADHPLANRLRDGWRARLEPLRRHGSWPGLDVDIDDSRQTTHDGPAVVVTLGRLRLTQAARFLRTSAKAEAAAITAPGMTWATALARPPFVCTCSIWESSRALAAYAYGSGGGHLHAITADTSTPFHTQSAFVRFRPYHVQGSLSEPNPLTERALRVLRVAPIAPQTTVSRP